MIIFPIQFNNLCPESSPGMMENVLRKVLFQALAYVFELYSYGPYSTVVNMPL